MSIEYLLALAAATLVLVLLPGPNVALIVSNSIGFGTRAGAITVLGTTAGVALQLLVVVLGFSALLEVAAGALNGLRWLGVGYLLWLGIRTWRAPVAPIEGQRARPDMFWRASLIAAANPKTLMFNAAFLPQFVPAGGGAFDLAISACVFLAVLSAGDLLWVLFAASARPVLERMAVGVNRVAGGFMVLAAAGLAAARRPD